MEERRIVTVLFCDVTGSTSLAEHLDLEEWAEVIAEAFPLLIEPVERYGGTVARLMGDAILAFFGAPVAREDDPQRAILAALGVLEGLKPFREEFERDYGQEFNVRIGINTGDVIVGEFGTSQTFEYTAMGDAVNIAARMEQMAAPGTIQVAESTYRLAQPYFDFEPLGAMEVRGKDEPVDAYRVIGQSAQRARYRHRGQLISPTVGRDRERAQLAEVLSQLEGGTGGILSIVGDAGLGKSRMVEELRRLWMGREGGRTRSSWIEHRVSSIESEVPYVLIERWLKDRLELGGSGSEPDVRSQLLRDLGSDDKDSAARMADAAVALLEVAPASNAESANGHVSGDADDFREELTALLEWIWRGWVSETGAAIYVIDDLHWIDPASADLIEAVIDRCQDLPLLVVLVFRPDQRALSWSIHGRLGDRYPSRYSSLTLAPLDAAESGDLIDAMFSGAVLPPGLRREILDRVGGNPLFAEELVRSFIEQGTVVRAGDGGDERWSIAPETTLESIKIPESLQALVQDRVDRIKPDARQTLQLASVVGVAFSYHDLDAVSERRDRLPTHLEDLVSTMLIDLTNGALETDYRFHHALIWESVYGSILRRRRRRLHRHVGETLEQAFGDQLDERRLALLSRHFAEARDERAIAYSVQAADRALALHAPEEAVELYSRAIATAARLKAPFSEVHVHRQRGRALQTIGDSTRAREDYHHVLEVARHDHDIEAECQALIDIGESWEGIDYQRAGEWYESALESTRRSGDQAAVAAALGRVGNWYSNVQRLDDARESLIQALEILQALGDQRAEADVLSRLGLVETLAGDMEGNKRRRLEAAEKFEALDDQIGLSSALVGLTHSAGTFQFWIVASALGFTSQEALRATRRSAQIARSAGWRSGEAYALEIQGMVEVFRGEYDVALEHARAGLALARDIEHREWEAFGNLGLGLCHGALLDYRSAARALEESARVAASSSVPLFYHGAIAMLAQVYIATGEIDQAIELERELAVQREIVPASERGVRFVGAELALARGNPEAALEHAEDLFETALNCNERSDIPLLARLRGRALMALGEEAAASEAFEEAIAGATRDGPKAVIWESQVDLGKLRVMSEDHLRAVRHFEASQAAVSEIASSFRDESVRTDFVARATEHIDQAKQKAGL